jgi:hypothetical protein
MAADHVEGRVLRTLPDWRVWPRLLRRVYLLLPSHGVGDAGLESMCGSLGVSLEKLQETIKATPSFKQALEAYEKDRAYPKYPRKDARDGSRISHAMILKLYTRESSTALYLQAEDALPAPMIKQALEGLEEEFASDTSLQFFAEQVEKQKQRIEESIRDQLPSFEVVTRESQAGN